MLHGTNQALWKELSPGVLELEARSGTDYFVDRRAGLFRNNAPFLYQEWEGDFVARVRVEPRFLTTYDAGGLFVWADDEHWIKQEFELTDLGYPSIVSVVTNGSSDDSNGERMDHQTQVHLQVVRSGDQWALHHSPDGVRWAMARYFRLELGPRVRLGLEAQSPIGKGTTCVFRGFTVDRNLPSDLRKG